MLARLLPERRRDFLFFAALCALPFTLFGIVQFAPDCIVKNTLGVVCPGCGLGRSLLALSKGNIFLAISSYPPIAMGLIAYGLALAASTTRLVRGKSLPIPVIWRLIGILACIAIIGNWLLQLVA